jgi:hypothetical protein
LDLTMEAARGMISSWLSLATGKNLIATSIEQ